MLTYSQFREGFEHRDLAWFRNARELLALTRENIVNPTMGWWR